MSQLKDLWVGMETRDREDAGTDSSIFLTVTTNNVERLHHTFPDTLQDDQERGQANLYTVNVATNGINSDSLTSNSIQVKIAGNDQWSPRNIVVWGRGNDGTVIPLAIKTDITEKISNGNNEGKNFIEIPPVTTGNAGQRIRRLLMLMLTADADESGTPHGISLKINSGGTVVVDHDVTDTSQADQDTSQANLYFFNVKSAFTKGSLNARSITLRILGDNAWTPRQFFLFGISEREGTRPESLVPLVHVPNWSLGKLSTDITEGKPRVTLPLV